MSIFDEQREKRKKEEEQEETLKFSITINKYEQAKLQNDTYTTNTARDEILSMHDSTTKRNYDEAKWQETLANAADNKIMKKQYAFEAENILKSIPKKKNDNDT